jgi:hypothetical protein
MRHLLFACLVLAACAETVTPDDYEVVPDGKEDNYRSPTAQEFSAKADATVVLDAADAQLSDADRLSKAQDLVSAKLVQIGWFLNLWVADKEDEDANKSYGGFHAMARNASVKSLSITPDPASPTTFSFNFEATIAAQNDFLHAVGTNKPDLKMGKLTNDELLAGTWQGSYDVHTWDPSTQSPNSIETLPVVLAPLARSTNAYLDYNRLYADGKLEVGAQFGWDYNADRADLHNAEQLYNDLVGVGFKSPVASFKDLKLDSPPLTRTGTFDGKTVAISVKLVHPGMVASPSANAVDLRNALLDLLATKEVVLFNGHAGVSGRLLPADFQSSSAGNILPTEYPTLKLFDGYQILLVEGCQTYARFTDGFRQNPAKRGPNGELVDMDIVTSTSYTWTSQGADAMEAILWPLIGTSASKNVKPTTWDDILRTMNKAPNETSFMGVNGIDSDPHAHPYAHTELLGQSCSAASDCGGEGNVCAKASGTKVCASVCLDDAGCPSDYRCASIASGSSLTSTKACVAK